MAIYLSMQRVRFSSPDAYQKFSVVFGDVRHHLMTKTGFITSRGGSIPTTPPGTTRSASGPARKPSTTGTWTRITSTPRRGLPTERSWKTSSPTSRWPAPGSCGSARACGLLQDKPYDLAHEQAVLAEPCPKCGFHFPVMSETPNSTAVFKDLATVAGLGD